MITIEMTAFKLAERFLGTKEIYGPTNNPLIEWWHSLCGGEAPDEVAWCSSAANGIAYILNLPRSKSKAARSWLKEGRPVPLIEAEAANDVVILKRGPEPQPGPDVIQAQGHVGWFGGYDVDRDAVLLRGGNQGDEFNDTWFPASKVLGVRRLIG